MAKRSEIVKELGSLNVMQPGKGTSLAELKAKLTAEFAPQPYAERPTPPLSAEDAEVFCIDESKVPVELRHKVLWAKFKIAHQMANWHAERIRTGAYLVSIEEGLRFLAQSAEEKLAWEDRQRLRYISEQVQHLEAIMYLYGL